VSAASIRCGGAAQAALVTVLAVRWNDNHPGTWAVVFDSPCYDWATGLLPGWQRAVVDDFGDLVAVPA
jgi:hypothetical protein